MLCLYCIVLYSQCNSLELERFYWCCFRYWLDGTAASCCIVKVLIQRSIHAFTQAAKHWWIKLPIIWMWGSHSVYSGFLLAACFYFYCTMLLQNIVVVQVIDRKGLIWLRQSYYTLMETLNPAHSYSSSVHLSVCHTVHYIKNINLSS